MLSKEYQDNLIERSVDIIAVAHRLRQILEEHGMTEYQNITVALVLKLYELDLLDNRVR